jgi:hypothetical protein
MGTLFCLFQPCHVSLNNRRACGQFHNIVFVLTLVPLHACQLQVPLFATPLRRMSSRPLAAGVLRLPVRQPLGAASCLGGMRGPLLQGPPGFR